MNKVAIDITLFEEITNLASKLYDKDLEINKLLKESTKHRTLNTEIKDIRRNLTNMKRLVIENTKIVQKDIKKISLILNEYKERCRSSFVEFLKTLEMDLRKTLKPLVPSEVLSEQIHFKPINSDPELISSMNSIGKDDQNNFAENTTEKLNNHIQLLVNTLEEVAKNLIVITQTTYRCYYELVDPRLLYSEPPSPLAAPLPEYFSYDIGNISEENRKKGNITLSAKSKQKLIQKFLALQKSNGIKSPLTSKKIKEKLEGILIKDIKESDLLQFFKEEGIPVSEREKLVYEIIHSERTGGRDVSLEDIISSNDKKPSIQKKTSSKQVQEIEKSFINKFNNSNFNINALETFVDEKEQIPRNPSKINLIEKKHDPIPLLKIKPEKSIEPLVKIPKKRASTPCKSKNDKKNIKRTKTPVSKRKEKINK
jgi:hypothetical protein